MGGEEGSPVTRHGCSTLCYVRTQNDLVFSHVSVKGFHLSLQVIFPPLKGHKTETFPVLPFLTAEGEVATKNVNDNSGTE